MNKALLKRSTDLAALGAGFVSPNPMVGAVLISFDNTIIGEGWHKSYGNAHAEVNCVANATKNKHSNLIDTTLIVSLTPCSITGNTPPCTSLILKNSIRNVHIGCEDFTPDVKSDSLKILKNGKVYVVLEDFKPAKMMARFRNLAIDKKRPYVILKYARSADHFFGKPDKPLAISNDYSLRLTHKWRAHCDAILVGVKTALTDNPSLTQRHYFGKNPVRILLDRHGKTHQKNLNLFNNEALTIVFTLRQDLSYKKPVRTVVLNDTQPFIQQVLQYLYNHKLHILMVEGGATIHDEFIKENLWDEQRILESHKVFLKSGITAPKLPENFHIYHSKQLFDNTIHYYLHERLQKYI